MASTPWNPGGGGTATEWAECARTAARDAAALAAMASWRNAYMLAGLAVEHAFKARIMREERLDTWPSRRRRAELYTHDLAMLLGLSGLRDAIEREVSEQSGVGLSWLVVKDFDISARYPAGRPFPERLARDFVAGALELVGWLTGSIG